MLGIPADEILRISAKTGEGVPELLDAIVERIPPPNGDADAPLQALIFDSYLRPVPRRGELGARVQRHADQRRAAALHAGEGRPTTPRRSACACPVPTPVAALGPGEVGYLIAGIKDVGEARVGETVTTAARPARAARRATATRSRWCSAGSIPVDGDEFADLREALEKLRLNDSSFTYEPETSGALGFGFRCGFLGLLHMEIVRERLEREYDLVARRHRAERRVPRSSSSTARVEIVDNPSAMPDAERDRRHRGAVRQRHRAHADRVHRHAHGAVPAAARRDDRRWSTCRRSASSSSTACRSAEIVMDFFDQLKSRTEGLRVPRLRARRLPRVQAGEGRRAAQQRRRSTRSPRSCTATRRTTTASA